MTLVGRDAELAALHGALDEGRALVIRGGAGIGKSALLEAASREAEARGLPVLRTAGVETEAGFAYAGLHRLLRPLLGEIDGLGEIQRQALNAALGLGDDRPGEPFLVALAVLELLGERPCLLIADDVHWLDSASRTVIGIVGRRIGDRPVTLLAGLRDGYTLPELELDELVLEGLDDDAAASILDARAQLDAPVRARLLRESAGNPLALVELPLVAGDALLPLSARLEQAFAGRLRGLPDATQSALLVAAADEAGTVAEVLAAAGVERADLEPAVAAGLIGVGERVAFRHPLVRSAVYQAAPLTRRLDVHAALARTLADEDRRALHRASATVARDDDVAAGVAAVARRARARGAVLDAALTLARAARLTADVSERARRLLESADLAFEAGRPDLVREAVEEAQELSLGVRDRARSELLAESFHDGVAGDVARVHTLIDDARAVAAADDTGLALDLLLGAAVRCWWAGLDAEVRGRVRAAAEELRVPPLEPRLLAILGCVAPLERGAEIVARAPEAIAAAGEDPLGRWFVAMAAHAAGDHQLALSILGALAPQLRAEGRFGLLAQVLSMLQWDAAMVGDWETAETAAAEGDRIARDTGQRVWGAGLTCGLSACAAIRGDAARADALAADAEAVIVPHGLADMYSVLLAARGIAAVAAGRHEDAFAVLARAFDPADRAFHYRERFGALSSFAEAAAESGRAAEAHAVLADLAIQAGPESAPALLARLDFARTRLERAQS